MTPRFSSSEKAILTEELPAVIVTI